jgi:uncharacterized protein YndB with AHSA1/START domain
MNKATFTKDLENKRITVEREFNAPRERVWKAWTDVTELEKWWAPKPYKAVTESFEFREGGHWHYYMLSPEGEKSWCFVGYESIDAENSFSVDNGFADEKGNPDPNMPNMHWRTEFVDADGKTKVTATITFASQAEMQKIIDMGFEGGFTMGLNQLDETLSS